LALFAMLMNVVGKALMSGLFGQEDEEDEKRSAKAGDADSLLSVPDRMAELVSLRDRGFVDAEEFEAKRSELVSQI
jgi:hypothetical protein